MSVLKDGALIGEHDGTSQHDDFLSVFKAGGAGETVIRNHVAHLCGSAVASQTSSVTASEMISLGTAALDAFLQANVTGPVLLPERCTTVEELFVEAWRTCDGDMQASSTSTTLSSAPGLTNLRQACLRALDVDGVSPYSYISRIELFSLARYIFVHALAENNEKVIELQTAYGTTKQNVSWLRLRIHAWHYKLLTQPSLSSTNFTRSSQWSDIPTLAFRVIEALDVARSQIIGTEIWAADDTWTRDEKTQFLTESASHYIMLGRHDKSKELLKEAVQSSKVQYALSGALGKRTKFQEKSTSQLVVLAKSSNDTDDMAGAEDDNEGSAKPDALQLNNDTLLEDIHFTQDQNGHGDSKEPLSAALVDLAPDNQPQLDPLDQIILLTEATVKDAFLPADSLTSEEVLPYATRVLADKSSNWQVYTQALLVRSRIEVHRSRTVERGVLQMQALADQVLTDTAGASQKTETGLVSSPEKVVEADSTPAIQVTAPGQEDTAVVASGADNKPTTFFPALKASESAPAHVRLRYVHALSAPPRWHLESELAYAWAGVGSLGSALEIFKRLRLWAEVALCLASSAASGDEDGRGSGGEEKAKGIIRWRLFQRTSGPAVADADDEIVEDATLLRATDFSGPERSPPPPNAPRLWCILGDLEDDAAHYERAWEVSKLRYARAQKSLGEYYLRQKRWEDAQAAYKTATAVNRLSPEMWGRLGDISLRLGRFEEAAEAYSRSIGSANDAAGGEDARTWSNMGSALWSLYCEVIAKEKTEETTAAEAPTATTTNDDEDDSVLVPEMASRKPATLLAQSLAAYKKGASIAHDNWRIWDNVLTLGSRVEPVPVADMVLALKNIIRIRRTEDAIDADVLSALLQDAVLTKDKDDYDAVYEPPRGSPERLVTRIVEEEVVPLITKRPELWALVARLRAWRRDYEGAIEASERAWRAAVGSSGGGLLAGDSRPSDAADWTVDAAAWAEAVKRTDELVSALENWGPRVPSVGDRWRGKARSAIRSVMGRGKENWEDSDGWLALAALMDGLKVSSA